MNKIKFIKIVLLTLFCNISFSQELIIKGLVTDYDGLPFAGAIIKNKMLNIKEFSDFDGIYKISANIGDTLEFFVSKKLKNCYFKVNKTVIDSSNINVEITSKHIVKAKYCKTRPKELYVFIGKKRDYIYDNSYDECFIQMNTNIIAEYEIVEQIYGDLKHKILKFKDSQHASWEPFAYMNSKYSLLFVLKYCDEFYLETHREIYKTKNKSWALAYNSTNYSKTGIDSTKLQDIPFKNVKIKIKHYRRKYDSILFKLPYYKKKGKHYFPLKGNYVEDYFKLWNLNVKELNYDN